ncbi:aldehyde dehydrogenase family protein [Klebsiella pneumoniae]
MMNLSATHAVSVNPTTGEVVSSLQWASEREVDAAIALAAAGYRQWRQTPLADRADALRRIGAALRARGEEVAQMITLEGIWASQSLRRAARWRNRPTSATGTLNTAGDAGDRSYPGGK